MANTVTFDLVSPERRLASLEAVSVEIPGADGDLTAMADHAATITSLRPGLLRVTADGAVEEYVVLGGFAEISASGISVLAERAVPRGEMTQQIMDEMLSDAKARQQAAAEATTAGAVDDAAKLLADVRAIGAQIGLTTAS